MSLTLHLFLWKLCGLFVSNSFPKSNKRKKNVGVNLPVSQGPRGPCLFKSSFSSRFISSVTGSQSEMRFIPLQRSRPLVFLPELVNSPSSSSLGFCRLSFFISPPQRSTDPLVSALFPRSVPSAFRSLLVSCSYF